MGFGYQHWELGISLGMGMGMGMEMGMEMGMDWSGLAGAGLVWE